MAVALLGLPPVLLATFLCERVDCTADNDDGLAALGGEIPVGQIRLNGYSKEENPSRPGWRFNSHCLP